MTSIRGSAQAVSPIFIFKVKAQMVEQDGFIIFLIVLGLRKGWQGARIMVLGGATMDGPRHIWWNFVASSQERIAAAKEAWRAGDWMHGRFQLPPGDAAEFTPAP